MAKRASASKRSAQAPAAKEPPAKGRGALEAPPARSEAVPVMRVVEGSPSDASAPEFEGQYRVSLPAFEGPLDLLLHLIQQHEIDILNIPVSFITEKYLAYLTLMRSLSIDLASEYLVMAATLVHIKSKMLLPSVPAGQEDDSILGEEDEDPRAELVRRLLEYQKYKAAAAELGERGTLGRDVFMRGLPEPVPEGPAPFAPMGVFSLLDAFEKILKRTKVKLDHEVVFDRISITDRIVELTEKLSVRRSMRFEDLVMATPDGGLPTRFDVVITFLAVLEMARLKLLKVYQAGPLEPIHLQYGDGAPPEAEEEEPAADVPETNEVVAAPEGEVAAEEPAVPAEPEGEVAEEPAVPAEPEGEVAEEPAVPAEPESEVAEVTPVPAEPESDVAEAPPAPAEPEPAEPEPAEPEPAEPEPAEPEPAEPEPAEPEPAPADPELPEPGEPNGG